MLDRGVIHYGVQTKGSNTRKTYWADYISGICNDILYKNSSQDTRKLKHLGDNCHLARSWHSFCPEIDLTYLNRFYCLTPHPVRQLTNLASSVRRNVAYSKQATSYSTNIGYIPGY